MTYMKGDSKKEAYKKIGRSQIESHLNFKSHNSPRLDNFSLNQDCVPLQQEYNARVWCGCLIDAARKIDDDLDHILNSSLDLKDEWNGSLKCLRKKLKELFELKKSVRNIEVDIEEFVNVISINEAHHESTMPENVYSILKQVNYTFDTAFTLITSKTKSIVGARVTITNIILSCIAVGISIIALFENI